ncbi:MAG: hypothetical protein EOS20_18465 [Mesorhizobium sp.]|uniref:hypothetical protein n=1 Tax=Mesorhizobium sp. TaxID=1871066 RepID=UPI000FE7908F|nr:hypothetical protein [Mesorhizobium sp.]RWQ35493.1 MAG: hypothetical protein EOS20_18465 [Mesorhizobium sp.]RWQ38691.1 MAG: hypothetical protein EOS21_19315 [Mesorhizobium sp.]
MDDLTIDEVEKITDRVVRDLNSLARDEANEAIRNSSHWPKIYDGIMDSAISDGEVVEGEEHRRTLGELQEADRAYDQKIDELSLDADRLQEAIVAGSVDVAIDILRRMLPKHQFLSPAAEKMLAGIRGAQGALAL